MQHSEYQKLSLEELRKAYKSYLVSTRLSKNTVQVATSDSFYIWRKAGANRFWEIVNSPNFEQEALLILRQLLPCQPNGSPSKNVPGYLAQIRRFRNFVFSGSSPTLSVRTDAPRHNIRQTIGISLPKPCYTEVEKYLNLWNTLENYSLQESALDKLFFTLAPDNTKIEDILLKVSALNDFYSTNIYSVFPVAKHILSLNIDSRLKAGDPTLVDVIKSVDGRKHYSFATKYCSHHNPLEYPIYDSYVDKILRYFRDVDGFCTFKSEELKQYSRFKQIILAFRNYYALEQYTLKEIDQYLWLLGKAYFPKNYNSR